MEWKQITNWYMESDSKYRISKGAYGAPGRYTAWAPGSKTENPALAHKPTAKEAMQVCEDHFNNRSKP